MDRLEFCRTLARDAGRLAHSAFGRSATSMKGRHDVLTEMDGEVERFIRAALASRFPDDAVIGEQQRVGIARAVVHKPVLLIADEPTGNLDPDLAREVMSLFLLFNQVGVTVLIATHALDLVRALGRRVLHLDHGRLQAPRATGA